MLSIPCKYAIRSLILMTSKRKEQEIFKVSDIAEELDITKYYLAKILQKLTDAKYLSSFKGPNGGLKFLKSPEVINLDEVIQLYEGKKYLKDCYLGLPGCKNFDKCPVGLGWIEKKNELEEKFKSLTFAQIIKNVGNEETILKLIK